MNVSENAPESPSTGSGTVHLRTVAWREIFHLPLHQQKWSAS